MSVPTVTYRPATDRQISFIKRLLAERTLDDTTANLVDTMRAKAVRTELTTRDASEVIEMLLASPKAPSAPPEAPVNEETGDVDGGIYEDGDSLYRVYYGRESGRMLAKEVTLHEDGATYTYAGAARRVLSKDAKRLPLEQVGALGITAGNCLLCGRDLSDPESLDRGIGPICAQNYEVA